MVARALQCSGFGALVVAKCLIGVLGGYLLANVEESLLNFGPWISLRTFLQARAHLKNLTLNISNNASSSKTVSPGAGII